MNRSEVDRRFLDEWERHTDSDGKTYFQRKKTLFRGIATTQKMYPGELHKQTDHDPETGFTRRVEMQDLEITPPTTKYSVAGTMEDGSRLEIYNKKSRKENRFSINIFSGDRNTNPVFYAQYTQFGGLENFGFTGFDEDDGRINMWYVKDSVTQTFSRPTVTMRIEGSDEKTYRNHHGRFIDGMLASRGYFQHVVQHGDEEVLFSLEKVRDNDAMHVIFQMPSVIPVARICSLMESETPQFWHDALNSIDARLYFS